MTKRQPLPHQPEEGNPLPLEYETRPPRDRRLTLAQWFALAPLVLTCVVVPSSLLAEGYAASEPVGWAIIGWAFSALFVGLVFVSALNLFTWSRDNWASASSHERTTVVAVCAVLLFYAACIVLGLVESLT